MGIQPISCISNTVQNETPHPFFFLCVLIFCPAATANDVKLGQTPFYTNHDAAGGNSAQLLHPGLHDKKGLLGISHSCLALSN